MISIVLLSIILLACSNQWRKDASKSGNTDAHKTHKKQETNNNHKKKLKNGVTFIDDILIVNKKIPLPSDYNPGVDNSTRTALTKLLNDGNKEGLKLTITSGFRSYQRQQTLFNNYVKKDGEKAANKYSAKPGSSEHQSGLSFDIGSTKTPQLNFSTDFVKTKAGKWLKAHAHEYGFIIRYPKGKEGITEYQYEPWHIRYVGKRHAKTMHKSRLTLEEYLGLYPGK